MRERERMGEREGERERERIGERGWGREGEREDERKDRERERERDRGVRLREDFQVKDSGVSESVDSYCTRLSGNTVSGKKIGCLFSNMYIFFKKI